MAKGPSPSPSPVPTAAAPSGFAITFGEAPPATVRKVGMESSPFAGVMKSMQAPGPDGRVAQFFVPVEASASISDAGEQAKYKSGEARKITNRISGIARRLKKADANMVFAMRTREENGVLGVRVYRVAPSPATA